MLWRGKCCFEGLFVHIAKLSVITVAILHWGNAMCCKKSSKNAVKIYDKTSVTIM